VLAVTDSQVDARKEKCFQGYYQCMDSLATIVWNETICRKVASKVYGKGIFALQPLGSRVCVAAYSGHLVDDKGNVVVICPVTEKLFTDLPKVQRPYSRSHGVKINKVGLFTVDGMFYFIASVIHLTHVPYRQSPCLFDA
jgi:hypothetical protein